MRSRGSRPPASSGPTSRRRSSSTWPATRSSRSSSGSSMQACSLGRLSSCSAGRLAKPQLRVSCCCCCWGLLLLLLLLPLLAETPVGRAPARARRSPVECQVQRPPRSRAPARGPLAALIVHALPHAMPAFPPPLAIAGPGASRATSRRQSVAPAPAARTPTARAGRTLLDTARAAHSTHARTPGRERRRCSPRSRRPGIAAPARGSPKPGAT
jgi:hypothetical protein